MVRKKKPLSGKSSRAIAVAVGEHMGIPAETAVLATASALSEEAGPMIASTPWDIRVSRATAALDAVPPSSASRRRTGWPRTPPTSLMDSTPARIAEISGLPNCAPLPVDGSNTPIFSCPSEIRGRVVVVVVLLGVEVPGTDEELSVEQAARMRAPTIPKDHTTREGRRSMEGVGRVGDTSPR